MPGVGWHFCTTTPGSRWVAGSITQIPYVASNSRRIADSLAIPFWADTTTVSAGACAEMSSRAAAVW